MSTENVNAELVPLGEFGEQGLATDMQTDGLKAGGAGSPFVFFAHPNQEKYAELCIKLKVKVPEGAQIYQDGETQVNLTPMKFLLPDKFYSQYWAIIDNKNTVLQASRTEVRARGWKEHIDAVVLAWVGDTWQPARMTFRGPKCTAAKTLDKERKLSTVDGWDTSDAHRIALKLPQPWTRVVGTVTLSAPIMPKWKAKPGEPEPKPYIVADCGVQPIDSVQYRALQTQWGNEDFKVKFNACVADLNGRLTDIKGKVK